MTDIQNITQSSLGPVHSKFRPMIIVALYRDHYIVVPIYSHQKRGLENPRYDKDEWISIQDHRADLCEQQSHHPPLVTFDLDKRVYHYHPKSAAHIAAPMSRSYSAPCKIEGILDSESVLRLVTLYLKKAPKPDDYELDASR